MDRHLELDARATARKRIVYGSESGLDEAAYMLFKLGFTDSRMTSIEDMALRREAIIFIEELAGGPIGLPAIKAMLREAMAQTVHKGKVETDPLSDMRAEKA